ncbi:geranylgeranyl pyrophosphate synthase [Neoconidiobolus thromboides FSU 785]|nr:geranylgeranyl pyrophosphate synthase [Neoconidiobolus thromboides FSU 785]
MIKMNFSKVNENELLLEPYNYLSSNPGKSFCTKLLGAFQLWLKIDDKYLKTIGEVLEMLHSASLLIDDVQDNSELRRGIPVAHRIYGVPITINCANYIYFLALRKICELDNPKLIEIYSLELINLHKGQGMELHCRDRSICPTQEEYLDIVNNKTGGLLRLGVKMMQEVSDSKEDYVPLVNLLGKLYQIRDDYINLKTDEYHSAKGFCEDLSEGKYSFPIIHSLRTSNNIHQLENILKQRSENIDLKKYALKLMEETNSFGYTRDYLLQLLKEIRAMIENLGSNPLFLDLITKLESGVI